MTRKVKDSGIEWIGEIPEDWEVSKIGSHYIERNEKVSDLDFEPLSVTKNGIVPQLDTAAKSSNHNNRKLVLKDDFVINSRSDRKMSSGISDFEGSVSVINTVLYSKTMDKDYTKYLLKNYSFAEEFYKWGTGIVDDLWSTKWTKMKNISIPVPPNFIQRKIGTEIDRIISNVDNIIKQSLQSITELKKYKQSLITEAVTKGLNPNVEMKDSKIEWIGEIPNHWEEKSLKYIVDERKEQLKKDTDPDFTFNYVDISSVSYEKGIEAFEPLKYVDSPSRARKIVQENDVIISTVRTYLKSIVRIKRNTNFIVSTGFCVLTPKNKCNSTFLEYLLKADYFTRQVEMNSKGIAYPSITGDKLLSIKVIVPLIEEQREIVFYLDEQTSRIDKLIEDKTKVIGELESYKKSLIYEYVTGKKEV